MDFSTDKNSINSFRISKFDNDFTPQTGAKCVVSDINKFRKALPLGGNIGAVPDYIINPPNVRITFFSVVKP